MRKLFNKKITAAIFIVASIFPVAGFCMTETIFEIRPRVVAFEHGKSQNTYLEVENIYKEIDIEKSYQALQVFTDCSEQEQKQLVAQIEKNMGDYNPAALLGLSYYYYQHDNIERAILIMRLAELRMLIDAACSTKDPSLQGIYPMMGQEYFMRIGLYQPPENSPQAKQFLKLAKKMLEPAIELDKKLPRNYDRRWMYLLGLEMQIAILDQKYPNAKALDLKSISVLKGKEQEAIITKIYSEKRQINDQYY